MYCDFEDVRAGYLITEYIEGVSIPETSQSVSCRVTPCGVTLGLTSAKAEDLSAGLTPRGRAMHCPFRGASSRTQEETEAAYLH